MSEIHPYRKAHPHSRLLTIEAIFYLAFVVFLFLLSGFVTNANPAAVLLAFLPALALGIVLIILVETDHFMPTYNWFVMISLLVLAAIVYFSVPSALVQGIDAGTALALNAIIMAIALAIMHNSYAHEKPLLAHVGHERQASSTHAEQVVHHVHHVPAIAKPQEITDVVHSIEDKIKALNFVIGRVYSVYHGGTERLRGKIRIEKEWYDTFNEIDESDIEKRRHEAIVLLQKISDRLASLQRTEKDLFGEDVQRLKNIQHDGAGGDRVIDVLIRNDKDPVQKYYDGAQQFCSEALHALKGERS